MFNKLKIKLFDFLFCAKQKLTFTINKIDFVDIKIRTLGVKNCKVLNH